MQAESDRPPDEAGDSLPRGSSRDESDPRSPTGPATESAEGDSAPTIEDVAASLDEFSAAAEAPRTGFLDSTGQPVTVTADTAARNRWAAPFRHLEEGITSFLLIGVVSVTTFGVFNRYVLGQSVAWSEPLARYLLIWLTFFGAVVAVKHDMHMSVELFTERIPTKALSTITLLGRLMQVALFGFLIYFGYQLAQANTAPTTVPGIRRDHILIVVPISATFMLVHALRHLWNDVRSFR